MFVFVGEWVYNDLYCCLKFKYFLKIELDQLIQLFNKFVIYMLDQGKNNDFFDI
jgi:hypothetical protein